MSKKTSYLLGILLTIVIGTLLYCYLCDNCNCSGGLNAESTDKDNIVGDAQTTIDATKAGDNAKATSDDDSTTADAKTATYNSFIIKRR